MQRLQVGTPNPVTTHPTPNLRLKPAPHKSTPRLPLHTPTNCPSSPAPHQPLLTIHLQCSRHQQAPQQPQLPLPSFLPAPSNPHYSHLQVAPNSHLRMRPPSILTQHPHSFTYLIPCRRQRLPDPRITSHVCPWPSRCTFGRLFLCAPARGDGFTGPLPWDSPWARHPPPLGECHLRGFRWLLSSFRPRGHGPWGV